MVHSFAKRLFIVSLLLLGLSVAVRSGTVSSDSLSITELEQEIKSNLVHHPVKADSLAIVFLEHVSGKNDTLEAMGWYYRAESAYYNGDFNRAGDFYEKGLNFLEGIDLEDKKAIFYNNLGLTRYYKSRFNEALEAFSSSAKCEQEIGNIYGFAQCLHNIALIQDKAGDTAKAEKYFKHAQRTFLEMDSLAAAAAVCNDYAIFLTDMGKNNRAIEMYGKALDFFTRLGDKEGVAKVECNLGALYLYEADYAKSARYLDQALEFFKNHEDESYLINIYSLLGDLYFEQNRTALSVVFYERAEKIANRMGWEDLRQKNLYSLFLALKRGEEYERAVGILETYSHLKDSMITANSSFVAGGPDKDIERELTKKELNLANAKVREKNLLLIILVLLLIIGLGGWFIYGRNRLMKHQKEKHLMQQKMTRIQMNPHFIFNALTSLQNYIMSDQKGEASEYLSDIAFLIRKMTGYSEVELVSLTEEKEVLNKYLKVQCRRYYQTIDCGVSSEIISDSCNLKVPPLLSRPLIDDFFAKGKNKDCCCPGITILYEQKEKELEVTIENKGVVVSDSQSTATYAVIEERITSLRKDFGLGRKKMERVDIINDGEIIGTRLRYWLPLINVE